MRSGSAWARNTAATGASNSRSKSMNGTPSGAVTVSGLVVMVDFSLVLGEQPRRGRGHLLFVGQAVAVDPGGRALRAAAAVEVHRAALGVARPGDEAGLLEHLDVLGHRLLGDGEWFGELVDRCRAAAEAGDDPPPNRVGERHERPVEPVVGGRVDDDVIASLYHPNR